MRIRSAVAELGVSAEATAGDIVLFCGRYGRRLIVLVLVLVHALGLARPHSHLDISLLPRSSSISLSISMSLPSSLRCGGVDIAAQGKTRFRCIRYKLVTLD